jgi:moderate conductance mechanosensitive channel
MLAASDVVHVLVDRPLKVAIVIAVAFVANWIVHRAINRFVRRIQGEPAREALTALVEGQTPTDTQPLRLRRAQRAETVAALLRSVTSIVIWVMAFLTALSQLNLELGPLIAGASIAGVAISFGAQNLVRDFLAGVFVLLEDQYGVGDMIETDAATGRVEVVSLRSTQVRDLYGTLWHIPNGELKKVGNFSQGWSQAVLDVEVAEDADLEATKRTIEKAARELMDDPDLGPRIMDDPQVWGVERIGDGAVAIRLVVRTSPRARWRVERELRARVKQALQKRNVPLKAVS